MRFREFNPMLFEDAGNVYVIGDSIAVGIANAGHVSDASIQVGGSNTNTVLNFVRQFIKSGNAKGATVILSSGAANSSKNVDADGKQLQGENFGPISSQIQLLKQAGAKVVLVGVASTKTPLQKPTSYTNGKQWTIDYTGVNEQLESIASSNGAKFLGPLENYDNTISQHDGIHPFNGYSKLFQAGSTGAGSATDKDLKPEHKNFLQKAADIIGGVLGGAFVISVPDSIRSPDVADVQKGITALGYKLPRYGIDGIRGKETSGAIASFQKDNGIEPTGVPDQATVDKLNSILKSKPDILKTLTKSTKDDVKSRAVDKNERSMAPIQYDGVTKGKVGNVLNMIAGVESRGYYDMMNGSKRYPEILEMTLNELLKFQSGYRGGSSSAAGRYQYVPDTLVNVGRKMGADFNKQKFDPAFQDKLAIFDMRLRCRLDDWLDNKISDKAFLNLLSNVWAGLPNTISGNSTYLGVLDNKAGISTNVALNTLNNIKSA